VGTVILCSNETSAVENALALHKRASEVTAATSTTYPGSEFEADSVVNYISVSTNY